MQLKPINQQVVVVVGASSGIGRETALQFAKKGARVVVAARSQPALESLVAEIRDSGGEATAVFTNAKGVSFRSYPYSFCNKYKASITLEKASSQIRQPRQNFLVLKKVIK